MNAHEAAAALDGNQYTKEGSRDLFAEMKAAGLVAVFGASGDLMEFRGAIDDELGAYGGTTAYLTRDGLLTNQCEDDDCPYFAKLRDSAETIDALFGEGEFSWSYDTMIPHATFIINEDDDPYCKGIVFALADVGAAMQQAQAA